MATTSRSDLSQKIPLGGSVLAKSFLLEVHTDDPHASLPRSLTSARSRTLKTRSCPASSRPARAGSG